MTPCDAQFHTWWQCWQRQQAGIATFHDLIIMKMTWELSMAMQRKLGALDD
ncbi:hypothetical protein [Halomonas sp. 707B3]|uniref:hypothetical protein n=1 Tax=Halomonas sp. 707B3 TaxID=1681043 RepID=UPI00209CB01B|nr:hypothetical protein [Halomonas sp. 707B3]MCP1316374.1 hypothetical protein [Halomonas sp. 707B3]